MIIQPRLVMRTRARTRLLIAVAVFVVGWIAVEAWSPHAVLAMDIKEALFGSLRPLGGFDYLFPVFPWLSLAIAASAIGHQLGVLCLRGDDAGMERTMLRFAAFAAAAAAVLNATYHVVRHAGLESRFAVTALWSPFSKDPCAGTRVESRGRQPVPHSRVPLPRQS